MHRVTSVKKKKTAPGADGGEGDGEETRPGELARSRGREDGGC